ARIMHNHASRHDDVRSLVADNRADLILVHAAAEQCPQRCHRLTRSAVARRRFNLYRLRLRLRRRLRQGGRSGWRPAFLYPVTATLPLLPLIAAVCGTLPRRVRRSVGDQQNPLALLIMLWAVVTVVGGVVMPVEPALAARLALSR